MARMYHVDIVAQWVTAAGLPESDASLLPQVAQALTWIKGRGALGFDPQDTGDLAALRAALGIADNDVLARVVKIAVASGRLK